MIQEGVLIYPKLIILSMTMILDLEGWSVWNFSMFSYLSFQ
jgi:hypothetical protein